MLTSGRRDDEGVFDRWCMRLWGIVLLWLRRASILLVIYLLLFMMDRRKLIVKWKIWRLRFLLGWQRLRGWRQIKVLGFLIDVWFFNVHRISSGDMVKRSSNRGSINNNSCCWSKLSWLMPTIGCSRWRTLPYKKQGEAQETALELDFKEISRSSQNLADWRKEVRLR